MLFRRRLRRMRMFVLIGGALLATALLLVREKPSALYAAAVTATIAMATAIIVRVSAELLSRQYAPSFRVLTPARREQSNPDEARFFRSPPQWQDFERQCVVPRSEMQPLIAALRGIRKGLLLVQGDPASGKTVLARHTEYTLLASRWFRRPLYRVEAKRLSAADYQTLYTELDDVPDGAVVIIDDVHLHFEVFAEVAERFSDRAIAFVYVSRPLSNLPISLTERFGDHISQQWKLSSGAAARKIVEAYLTREVKMSADAVANIAAIFVPYYLDLWVLAAALKTYSANRDSRAVFRHQISEWVCEHVVAHSETIPPPLQPKRARALAVAAALYQFEIPVDRRFLQTMADLKDEDMAALLRVYDLQDHGGSAFALYHSSYAKLILEAVGSQLGIGLVPASCLAAADALQLEPARWADAVVVKHLNDVPGRTITDLATLSAATEERREMVLEAFRCVQDAAVNAALDVRFTRSVQAVGSLLQLFVIAERTLQPSTKSRLNDYAKAAEGTTDAWAWATENAARLNRALALPFVEQLAQRLRTESARVIARVATTLSYADMNIANVALTYVDPQTLARRAADECPALLDFAVVVAKIVWVRPEWISAFIQLFDQKSTNSTTVDFGHAISRVAWGSAIAAEQLVSALSPARLTEMVSRGRSDTERANALGILATVARQSAVEVCGRLAVAHSDALLATMVADITRGPEIAWAAHQPDHDNVERRT